MQPLFLDFYTSRAIFSISANFKIVPAPINWTGRRGGDRTRVGPAISGRKKREGDTGNANWHREMV